MKSRAEQSHVFVGHAIGWGRYRLRLALDGANSLLFWTAAMAITIATQRLGLGGVAYFLLGFWTALLTPLLVFQLRDVIDLVNYLLTGEKVVRRIPPEDVLKKFHEELGKGRRRFVTLLVASSPFTMIGRWANTELARGGGVEIIVDESLGEQLEQASLPFREQLQRTGPRRKVQGWVRRFEGEYREDMLDGFALQGR